MKAYALFSRVLSLLFVCMILLTFGCGGDDDPVSSNPTWQWSALGDGLPGNVYAVAEYGHKLYAGGEFYGGTLNGLRVLEGRQWTRLEDNALDAVTSGNVYGLITYNRRLIVSGDFRSVDPITTIGVAAWDGQSWHPLAGGLPTGAIGGKMAEYDGQLYVASRHWLRDFWLMAWNGSSWTTIKSGGTGHVMDMCVYDGKLIVCADTTVDYGGAASRWTWIRAWDGSTWTDMSNGSVSPVALCVFRDSLYTCGQYDGNLRRWTGSTWQSVASATFHDNEHIAVVTQLICHDDKMVLAGDFDEVNGTVCSNIVTWDGSTFAPISCGLTGQSDPRVTSLDVIGDRLIAGGSFTTIGTVESPHIAEWSYR